MANIIIDYTYEDPAPPPPPQYNSAVLVGNWAEERRGKELLEKYENQYDVYFESTQRESYKPIPTDVMRKERMESQDLVEALKLRQYQAKISVHDGGCGDDHCNNMKEKNELVKKKKAQWKREGSLTYGENSYETTNSEAALKKADIPTNIKTERKTKSQAFTKSFQIPMISNR